MRRHAKASSTGSISDRGGSLAPLRGFLGAALGAVLLFALFAASARAGFVETGSWALHDQVGAGVTGTVPSGGSTYSYGVAIDPVTDDVFTSHKQDGEIDRWTTSGSGDPTVTGAGDGEFTQGSKIVSNIDTSMGAFHVGDLLVVYKAGPESAVTMPAGVTVEAVDEADHILTLSAAPSVNGTHFVQRFATSSPTETLTNVSADHGSFAVGDRISGPGLPLNARITAVGSGTLGLSTGVGATRNGVSLSAGPSFGQDAGSEYTGLAVGPDDHVYALGKYFEDAVSGDLSLLGTGTGEVTESSTSVTGVSVPSGAFGVGQSISGAGIPAGTTIAGCTPDCASPASLTLSQSATATHSGDALTSGSREVTGVGVLSGAFSVGQAISGAGIPSGTTVAACTPDCSSPTGLTLSQGATAAGNGVLITAGTPFTGIGIFQPGGTLVGEFPLTQGEAGPVGIDVDSSGDVYVPNKTAHTVEKYDSSGDHLLTFGPNPGGTALNGPDDVAVDAAGNVYAADPSANEVNEVQTYNLDGGCPSEPCTKPSGGTFNLLFDGASTAATFDADVHAATGKGDITEGSNVITNVVASEGAFEEGVGMRVSGPGIPGGVSGARITSVDPLTGDITLESPAEATVSEDSLSAGSFEITNVTNQSQPLASGSGIVLTGPGIPPEAASFTYKPAERTATFVTLSGLTSHAGQGVPLTTSLSFTQAKPALTAALSALPTIGGVEDPEPIASSSMASNNVSIPAATRAGAATVTFQGAMGGRDLPQLTCNGSGLTGASAPYTCTSATTTNGSSTPGRVVKFDSSGTFVENFVPATGSFTADAIAIDGSSGDVYVAGGNSHWAPLDGKATPSGPEFAVRRYSSAGVELNSEIGLDSLAAEVTPQGAPASGTPVGPFFSLAVDPDSHRLYADGPTGNGSISESGEVRSVVHVFSATRKATVAINLEGAASGEVSAESGEIEDCTAAGGPECEGEYVEGEEIVLAPSAGNHSEIDWTGAGCDSVDPSNRCHLTIPDHDVTLTPTNRLIPHTLTVSPEGNGSGEVDAGSGAIEECSKSGGTCQGTYGESETIHLHATHGDNEAVSWEGCDTATGDDCTIEIPEGNATVKATFALNQRQLTITKVGEGEVECLVEGGSTEEDCEPSYADGTELELVPQAGTHSHFEGWSEGAGSIFCSGTGNCGPFTITANSSVKATFAPTPRALTINASTGSGGGTVKCDGGACASSYNDGTEVELEAVPNGHSSFTGWSVTGSASAGTPCTGITNPCKVKLEGADVTVGTGFDLIPRALTINATGEGEVKCKIEGGSEVACAGPYGDGTEITLVPHAGPHASFSGWSGGTGSAATCSGTGSCTFQIEGGPATVNAPFPVTQRSLGISTNGGSGGGAVKCDGSACASSYNDGTEVELEAVPNGNSAFTGWTVSGSASTATPCTGATNPCKVKLEGANVSAAAAFTLQYTLNVTATGDSTGTVDADSGAVSACSKSGGTCAGTYREGTTVVLTADPAAHTAVSWTGCGTASGNQCSVEMDSAKAVTATFTTITHALSIAMAGSGSGSVSCDGGACAASYPEGSAVTLAATADSGSEFAGWSGGGCSGSGSCTVAINADTAVTATFNAKPAPPAATPPPSGGGEEAKPKQTYGKCLKGANKAYKKALKKAKSKHGKARAQAIKAAKKKNGKAVGQCKVKFHEKSHRANLSSLWRRLF